MSEFKEYRADGWPLCPHCGGDELWSPLIWLDERPPVKDFIAAGLRCYLCGWSKDAISPNDDKGLDSVYRSGILKP